MSGRDGRPRQGVQLLGSLLAAVAVVLAAGGVAAANLDVAALCQDDSGGDRGGGDDRGWRRLGLSRPALRACTRAQPRARPPRSTGG